MRKRALQVLVVVLFVGGLGAAVWYAQSRARAGDAELLPATKSGAFIGVAGSE